MKFSSPIFAVVVLLLFSGGAMAGPAQTAPNALEHPEESLPEECSPRLAVVAVDATVLMERRVCLNPNQVESAAALHDQRTWLSDVTPEDTCTFLSWSRTESTQWLAASCHDDSEYGDDIAFSACNTLSLSQEARLDLCLEQKHTKQDAACLQCPSAVADAVGPTAECLESTGTGQVCTQSLQDPCGDGESELCPDAGRVDLSPLQESGEREFVLPEWSDARITQLLRSDEDPDDEDKSKDLGQVGQVLNGTAGRDWFDTVNQTLDNEGPGDGIDVVEILTNVVNDKTGDEVNTVGRKVAEAEAIVFWALPCMDVQGRFGYGKCPIFKEGGEWGILDDGEGGSIADALLQTLLEGDLLNDPPNPLEDTDPNSILQELRDPQDPEDPPDDPPEDCTGSFFDIYFEDCESLEDLICILVPSSCTPPPTPCQEGVQQIGGDVIVDACGTSLDNPCPNPVGSASGALVVVCGRTVPDPCPEGMDLPGSDTLFGVCGITFGNPCPEGADSTQACGEELLTVEFHTDLEPGCGGAYLLGATVTRGGSTLVSPLSGTVSCPLPYTTPAYPYAVTPGSGASDYDGDGVPEYLVLEQRRSTIHPSGVITHEGQEATRVRVDPDDRDPSNPVDAPAAGVGVDPVQQDVNGNGIGDKFEAEWDARAGYALNWVNDLDDDGLSNVDEFRWDLVPICIPSQYENCRDWERDRNTGSGGDGWLDGPEVAYWNDDSNDAHVASLTPDGLAVFDPDRHHDVDGDGLPDTRDLDADDDGLFDGEEVNLYRTYPEFKDSDCAATATSCTPSHQSRFYDADRRGSPGTGDGIPDEAEVEAWNLLAGASWYGDADGDGIPNILDADSDSDGLDDGPEFLEGRGQVRPDREDSDNDEVLDGDEALWNVDSDADGWINAGDPDSDDDGMPDGYEVHYGFNPLDLTDALQDADQDGLSNVAEYRYLLPASHDVRTNGVYWGGTDPLDPDSDDDELLDGPEVLEEQTNPFHWDTDGDGLPDAWEARYKLLNDQVAANPRVSDALRDGDEDSVDVPWCRDERGLDYHNQREYEYGMPTEWDSQPVSLGGDGVYWGGTQPNNPNTDGDFLPDGYEVCSDNADPTVADVTRNWDEDQDGLLTLDEVQLGTDYLAWDTDGDGLCDGGGQAWACFQAAGAGGDGEVRGWTRVLDNGEVVLVTSDPLDPDTDDDLLGDLAERLLGTDPRLEDTDDDGLIDGLEDSNGNGVRDGGELDALNPDSDDDGLTDGEERFVYFTDGLDHDTDFDGLTDGAEVQTHGTDPLDHDTDDDLLNDGEDLDAGTDLLDADSDGDGFLDGEEVLHFALDPNDPDGDCDGFTDGTDANPYANNVPPGIVRSAADRAACRPAGLPSTAWDHAVGWVDFDSNDGTITVLGAYPPSENEVVYGEVLMVLHGVVRTSASGTLEYSSATLRAELRPLEEPASAGTAVYTHGVRLVLPQGMVEATSADFSLTYIDANLNAASYEGSASQFTLHERLYQDEGSAGGANRPGCEHFWWESEATGEAGSSSSASAPLPGIVPGGLATGVPGSLEGHTIVKLVQPSAPTFTGSLVDGVLEFDSFQGSLGQFVVYQNTSVEPSQQELELYLLTGWGGTSFSLSRMGQAVSAAWEATVEFGMSLGGLFGRAWTGTGESLVEAKGATVGFYHTFREECNHPLTWSANLILDLAMVGDIESIVYGATEDDNGEVAMGVIGIALSVVPVTKIAGVAKVGLRTGDKAGDAYDLARNGERLLRPMATLSVDAANAGGHAAKEAKFVKQSVLFDFAKKDPVHQRGLTRLAGVENTAEVGRDLVDNRLLIDFAGRLPGSDETAELFLRGLGDGPVDARKLAEASAKIQRVSPGDEHVFEEGVAAFNRYAGNGADNGIAGMVGSAAGRTKDYHAAGHAFQVMHAHQTANVAGRVVVKNGDTATEMVLDASKTKFNFADRVSTSQGEKLINVDNFYKSTPDTNNRYNLLLQEVKHYTGGKAAGYKGGEVPLNEFNRLQVEKYVALKNKIKSDDPLAKDVLIQYVIKGRASPELRLMLEDNKIAILEIPF